MTYGLPLILKNGIVKIAPKGRVDCVGDQFLTISDTLSILASHIRLSIPLREVGLPYDIATQIAILSSSSVSGHVSGHVIMVKGGMEGPHFPVACSRYPVLTYIPQVASSICPKITGPGL
ncbi:hypothetical protein BDN72DRAFT_966458 [Pluteus cervinus]|uniref:Uncharacterized protein n=1 Tax=Pluteus cervinus TaxID=181527 RepID=A0ACD2ZX08_9AGAR|nr:hypothetical protein BDN72DRAFT_966458 [Pluteus cervinus]